MTKTELEKRLKEIIEPYVEDRSLLENASPQTDLLRDLKVNSAHLVDIIIDMEEAFDIAIDDAAAEKMLTLGEAMAITEKLLAARD